MKKLPILPNADAILGSLRSIGYDLKTALADIIDNSIAAKSEKLMSIEIVTNDIYENDLKLEWIAIIDDGHGMTEDKINNALVLGGKGILEPRLPIDLGRFGLGLKTASLSQCTKFSIISKTKNTTPKMYTFDLEHIKSNGWEIYENENLDQSIEFINERLNNKSFFDKESWTIILWENIDRFPNIISEKFFIDQMEKISNHFSLIFHKFHDSLELRINQTKIDFWNPFSTAISSISKSYYFDNENNSYEIKTHILKHKSEFNYISDYENQSRIDPYIKNQGFWIYRNNRLISKGGWLGLYLSEPHYNFARVEINLPNTYESDIFWGVDISKSKVIIPNFAKSEILSECNFVRNEAYNVYKYHGGILDHEKSIRGKQTTLGNKIEPIWSFDVKGSSKGSSKKFSINQDNQIIQNFIKKLSDNEVITTEFKDVLRFIEETIPFDSIIASYTSKSSENNEISQEILFDYFIKQLNFYIENQISIEAAYNLLIKSEPFNNLKFTDEMKKQINLI
jgi:hypothetical protein